MTITLTLTAEQVKEAVLGHAKAVAGGRLAALLKLLPENVSFQIDRDGELQSATITVEDGR